MVSGMPPRRVIGIDAGGTKLLGGVVDDDLVVHHRVHRTWRGADRQETLDIFVEAVEEVRAAAPEVEAVGFGIPALVDFRRGVSVWSNHLPIDDVPFRDLMSERLGLPVVVDNDANVAALAEHRHGAAKGSDHAVLIALGTGIGGGLVLDGRIYRGAHGFGAELGHMVVDHDGERLPRTTARGGDASRCSPRAGRSGNWAARRPRALPERRSAGGSPGARRSRADSSPSWPTTAMSRPGRCSPRSAAGWARGSCGLVNVFDPEVIVVGGGAVAGGDLLLGPAREVVAERALPPVAAQVRIVAAHFGDESGMLGAALLALEQGVG